jgi:hypothetical protein
VLVPLGESSRRSRYVRDLSVEERKAFMTLFKITRGYRSEDRTGWQRRLSISVAPAQ